MSEATLQGEPPFRMIRQGGQGPMSRAAVDHERDALIAVDIQVDFCPGGALAVPGGDEVIAILNRWLVLQGLFRVASRDWHPSNHCSFRAQGGPWPAHRVQGTPGTAFHPKLRAQDVDLVVSKGTDGSRESYATLRSTDFAT